jgi:hypothetical protein
MANAGELQTRWRALAKRYPIWRILIDLLFDPASYRIFGSDITSVMMKSRKGRLAAQALEGASPGTLEALASIAEVNVSRTGEFLKATVFVYVSLPLGFAALLSDSAPEVLRSMAERQATSIVVFLIGAVMFPILFFCAAWRAKQISWVLQLYRAGGIEPLPAKGVKAPAP